MRNPTNLRDKSRDLEERATKEEKHFWSVSPLTRALKCDIEASIEELKEAWASGSFTGPSMDETAQLNAKTLGMVQALQDIIDQIHSLETPIEE